MDRTPNHICKNPKCTKGDDGDRKHYWACNDCDKRNSWKKAACDEECYVEYLDAIVASRGQKSAVVDEQISLFDEAPVMPEPDTTVEPTPIVEPRKDSNATFMGYYKKNKHR